MWLFLGTLLWSVRLCWQSSISRANGDRCSQVEKHVVVSVRSNLPQKSSTVLSEPKFRHPPPAPASCPNQKNSWIRPWTSLNNIQMRTNSSQQCVIRTEHVIFKGKINIQIQLLYMSKDHRKKCKAPCHLKAGFLPIKATILDKIKWNIKSPSPQIKGEA